MNFKTITEIRNGKSNAMNCKNFKEKAQYLVRCAESLVVVQYAAWSLVGTRCVFLPTRTRDALMLEHTLQQVHLGLMYEASPSPSPPQLYKNRLDLMLASSQRLPDSHNYPYTTVLCSPPRYSRHWIQSGIIIADYLSLVFSRDKRCNKMNRIKENNAKNQ